MRTTSKKLATVDAAKEALLNDIDELEIRLSEVNSNQPGGKSGTSDQITAIQKVKNLRKEITVKEEEVREMDDVLGREVDKLESLGRELKLLGQTQPISVQNNSNTANSRQRRHHSYSNSPHRLQASAEHRTPHGGQRDEGNLGRSYTTSHRGHLDHSRTQQHS